MKQGGFVIFEFSLVLQYMESQNAQKMGNAARKVSLSHPLSCAPNASKNWDLRAVSPYASRQSTG